jgi:hypothetical protein
MAILLVPGFMADATLWSDMTDALARFGPILHADLRHDASIEAMARRRRSCWSHFRWAATLRAEWRAWRPSGCGPWR